MQDDLPALLFKAAPVPDIKIVLVIFGGGNFMNEILSFECLLGDMESRFAGNIWDRHFSATFQTKRYTITINQVIKSSACIVHVRVQATEEGQKVARNKGNTFRAVYRRLSTPRALQSNPESLASRK